MFGGTANLTVRSPLGLFLRIFAWILNILFSVLEDVYNSRFVDTASGWFACADSDVESLHVYFRPVRLKSSRKPQVVSEFGGYTWKEPGHIFNPEKSYGYRSFRDKQAFMDALEMLYREQILPAK